MPSFGFTHKKREKQKPIPCEEAQQFTSLFQVPIKKNTHTKNAKTFIVQTTKTSTRKCNKVSCLSRVLSLAVTQIFRYVSEEAGAEKK